MPQINPKQIVRIQTFWLDTKTNISYDKHNKAKIEPS